MNFTPFSTKNTNIFPIANSRAGGQLLTEFNLRSRESVSTNESVRYMIGQSFVHSVRDYEVRQLSDGSGVPTSSTILEITAGRGVINGHFVESLISITVDLAEANARAKLEGAQPLKGPLCVGLRVMYSTLPTMAGAMLYENDESVYEGIQVVILPKAEFKLPQDVPTNENAVTAHILLGTFNFTNGQITNVDVNYPGKCQFLEASRIGNVNEMLSDIYVRKTGLNPKKLYSFAGKGTDPATGYDTWCDSTPALMVWDAVPYLSTAPEGVTYNQLGLPQEANFVITPSGSVQLLMPHQNVDGMVNELGQTQYYLPKGINIPIASFDRSTSGTVDATYTKRVKSVVNLIRGLYSLPNGKQRAFIPRLATRVPALPAGDPLTALPPISPLWNSGDYVIVQADSTFVSTDYNQYGVMSTMYVVIPGYILGAANAHPGRPSGLELAILEGHEPPPDNPLDLFEISTFRGQFGDYFTYVQLQDILDVEGNITGTEVAQTVFYEVSASSPKEYSDPPIILTGQVPLAEIELIGGFLNVDNTNLNYLDNGYVYRDDSGHLRVMDYAMLRSGVLAWQLGEDQTSPVGLTTEDTQTWLNELVNNRVAFPNWNQAHNSDRPNTIHVTIDLSAEDGAGVIDIFNIDSRFGTNVYLHINGTADANTTINIVNCERIRIDPMIGGNPTINIQRASIYYDADVLDLVGTITDMSLWYEKFEDTDPDLQVDGMTVMQINAPILGEDLDFWNDTTLNDNHFLYALRSLTFGSNGMILGCEMLVRNNITANIETGPRIITSSFTLPNGVGFTYPKSRLTKTLKVTGSFVSAYPIYSPIGYMIADTGFTAVTQSYDPYDDAYNVAGTIAFFVNVSQVTNSTGWPSGTPIAGWQDNAWHIFAGGVIN